jgi:hypothetical protein
MVFDMLDVLLTLVPEATNSTIQYLGEVQGADFITATDLITATDMGPHGTVTNATVSWLKFNYKGKVTYIAKKVLKHQMTWEQLDTLGLVFGSKQVTIGGEQYSVRLPKGYATPPTSPYVISTGGDLNDLIYSVYNGVSIDHPYVQAYPKQAAFTDADLGLYTDYISVSNTPGSMTWVQDSISGGTHHMVRFYNDSDKAHQLTAGWYVANGATQPYAGWRPILELIE